MKTQSQQERDRLASEYRAERAARCPKLTPSITWTNATTRGSYTGNSMNSGRAGADDHMQHRSAAMGAQIVRL